MVKHSKGLTWEWSGLVTGDCTGEGGGVGGKGVELVLVQRVLMLLLKIIVLTNRV